MWNERLVAQYNLPPNFLRVGLPMAAVVEQLARQGELGPGEPAAIAAARMSELGNEQNQISPVGSGTAP